MYNDEKIKSYSKEEREKIELEYMIKFEVDELPTSMMMQSVDSYVDELKGAIERGRPLEDEDRIDCDIIE